MPLIDVLLPVKNGGRFLAIALESLKQQSFGDWRVLVLDHGSTDGSDAVAERFARQDSRFEVHRLPRAEGLAGLLNAGLDRANGAYVLRHDADDIAFPDRLERMLAAFRSVPGCVVVGGQAEVINEAGITAGQLERPTSAARIAAGSFFWNPVAHPTVMMDLTTLNEAGIRYGKDILRAVPIEQSPQVGGLAEDYFLFGQLAILGKVINVPEKLIQYRRHNGSVGVSRFVEQMTLSLQISRFLMRSFCAIHGLAYGDPAPFCNHGGALFTMNGEDDFNDTVATLAAALRQGLGNSPELERELAFRSCLAIRRRDRMLGRYARFRLRHRPDGDEWTAVRGWLLRGPRGGHVHGVLTGDAVPASSGVQS